MTHDHESFRAGLSTTWEKYQVSEVCLPLSREVAGSAGWARWQSN